MQHLDKALTNVGQVLGERGGNFQPIQPDGGQGAETM